MEINLDCLPCFLNQVLSVSRKVTNDVKMHNKIMKEAINIIKNYKEYKYSPAIAREIHCIVKKYTGIEDPYREVKDKNIKEALDIYPYLKHFLNFKEDKDYWSIKIAAAGNVIDAAIYDNINVEAIVEQEINKKFKICHIDKFNIYKKQGSKLLIIADNAGETVFDRILIENFINFDITYAVREKPIINDATIEDAYKSGINNGINVISTGCDAPGTIIEECSDEFLKIYNEADIVISKGQGNFESLSDEKRKIFFLLKAKCKIVAKKLNVEIGDYVFRLIEN